VETWEAVVSAYSEVIAQGVEVLITEYVPIKLVDDRKAAPARSRESEHRRPSSSSEPRRPGSPSGTGAYEGVGGLDTAAEPAADL
jgi:hypothetical protein